MRRNTDQRRDTWSLGVGFARMTWRVKHGVEAASIPPATLALPRRQPGPPPEFRQRQELMRAGVASSISRAFSSRHTHSSHRPFSQQ